MANPRTKRADLNFDLFQGPPETVPPKKAPEELDLFSRPPSKRTPAPSAPKSEKPAPPKSPEPAPKPSEPPAPSEGSRNDPELFVRPPKRPEKAPTPKPPTPKPKPPTAKPPTPTPAPPKPETKPPAGKGTPGRQPPGPQMGTQEMKKHWEFKEFLKERYEGGKAEVVHPDHEKRKKRPFIKFWSAMRHYPYFKEGVKREFEAWRQDAEAKRPRAQPGDSIRATNDLRVGDFIQQGRWGDKYRVEAISPKSILYVKVDSNGRPKWDKPKRLHLARLRRHRRIEKMERPDVDYDVVKKRLDERMLFMPRVDRDGAEKYIRDYMKSRLYPRLGDDETKHQKRFEEQVQRYMQERGIDEGWEWKAPDPVQIGEPVSHPMQVKAGDYVKTRHHRYLVLKSDDKNLHLVKIRGGIPDPKDTQTLGAENLRHWAFTRTEPDERPDVSLDDAKKFLLEHVGYPPPKVNDYSAYKGWLQDAFRYNPHSPYAGLGQDEVEHQQALKKQIGKILEERGVHPGWTWTEPPEIDIGERIKDPTRIRKGHFLEHKYGRRYRVEHVHDDGKIELTPVDQYGRAQGPSYTETPRHFKNAYKRIEELKRPLPDYGEITDWADRYASVPMSSVVNQQDYAEWLKAKMLNNRDSPYFRLGKVEANYDEAYKRMIRDIKRILKDRNITADWTWTPPPRIEFSTSADWKKNHDNLLRAATKGKKIRHPDAPRGFDHASLGGGINGSYRVMKEDRDGNTYEYAWKPESEANPGGTYPELHSREATAYSLDRLFGEGTVVPPTATDGKGSYQQFQPGARNYAEAPYFDPADLERHQDVQRMIWLDAIMTHTDRHPSNLMWSKVDPDGGNKLENIRFHAIDNGYAFPTSNDYGFRQPWPSAVVNEVVRKVPPEVYEKMKRIKPADLIQTLWQDGLKEPKVLKSTAVRLRAFQKNPALLGNFMEQGMSARRAQGKVADLSTEKPLELISREDLEEIEREINLLS